MEKEQIIKYMEEALSLAEKAKGTTSPNPSVGAIIVKDNQIIGKGVTQTIGGDHAEIQAIKNCSQSPENASLIVTLEPCCFFGRTPPCVDAILKAKVKEVYIATLDPNEKVNGKGVELLRKEGIKVEYGFFEEKALKLNEDFFKWIKTGIPFVTIKYAMTLDGKMATATHFSKWITGEKAREDTHLLRYRSDAIMVGSNTIRCDNPTLNCRISGKEKYPLRVIMDTIGIITEEHTVISDEHPTLIVTPPEEHLISYYKKIINGRKNKATLQIQMEKGFINIDELLKHLGEFQITSVMVEGGSHTLYSFYKYNAIDKMVVYIAPKILTGSDGIIPFAGEGLKDINQALRLKDITYTQIGDDVKVVGYV